MTEQVEASGKSAARAKADELPSRVLLVPYPKIIFMYPIFVASIVAAMILSFVHSPLVDGAVSTIFLAMLGVNLVILAFDFPRTTSLALFFFAVALVLGAVLLFTFEPNILPLSISFLKKYRPTANAHFYWGFGGLLGVILLLVLLVARFDYWEVRPNELLHHHGFLSNLERYAAPNLRIDEEITDVFEYMLLRSGRLIIQESSEHRPIVLDNVPFIRAKEEKITRMLGALQVEVRTDKG
jgi:type IV secretory pathway VirB3-like protein